MGKKLTYEYVKSKFDAEGYTLLSKEYKDANTKLYYRCLYGHEHYSTWGNWQQGHRCLYCSGKFKKPFEEIKLSFESEGYVLLSDTYVNAFTKLDYICSKGHRHSIKWNDWQQGYRCPYCAGQSQPPFNDVKASFEFYGYVLLSDRYTNASTKLEYICPYGHNHSISWHKWKQGERCPTCAVINLSINRTGDKHWNWQGGKSFEPYCPIWKDQEYKSDIRERDGNRCLNPYCYGNDSVLSIHHIDYDKKNCHPSNLITVCRSCNSRANTNRTWHKSWYKAIMYRRYGVKGVKL